MAKNIRFRQFRTIALALFIFSVLSNTVSAQTAKEITLPEWAIGPFTRSDSTNPIISPSYRSWFNCPIQKQIITWKSDNAFNPAAVVRRGKVCVLFRAEDHSGNGIGRHTSRIGLARSEDGLRVKEELHPVLSPDLDDQKIYEWPGGCEDPRVAVTEDGLYVMMYTQWNQKVPRLAVATSKDLVNWTKHGPVFSKAFDGKFLDTPTKSASIVTRLEDKKLIISPVNGKYFMYWGEENVYGATSDDLINWEPILDANGNPKRLISPRKGYFDSQLTECGPPALLTDKGILLLYNGKNAAGAQGDSLYTPNSYCAGQVLFDKNDPTRVLKRLDRPFFYPQESYEKSGQYASGTVFIEGLVYFKEKWFLYYGCADSHVAVAVFDPNSPKK